MLPACCFAAERNTAWGDGEVAKREGEEEKNREIDRLIACMID